MYAALQQRNIKYFYLKVNILQQKVAIFCSKVTVFMIVIFASESRVEQYLQFMTKAQFYIKNDFFFKDSGKSVILKSMT